MLTPSSALNIPECTFSGVNLVDVILYDYLESKIL